MINILFVDDDPNILSSIKRIMFDVDEDWDFAFANSGFEALKILNDEPFDIIISDMRMPEMNGAQLLEEVKRLYPDTIRFILSGYSDRELILKTVSTAEQFITKPCEGHKLIKIIKRAIAANNIIDDLSARKIISEFEIFPAEPQIYAKLCQALDDENAEMKDIKEIIQTDIIVSTEVLKLVNSAFFGLRNRVDRIEDAISYLGFDVIKALTLSTELFSKKNRNRKSHQDIQNINKTCLKTAALTKIVLRDMGMTDKIQNQGYLAAIVSDIGKVIFLENRFDQYKEVLDIDEDKMDDIYYKEKDLFNMCHGELGAYLLCKWGFDDIIIDSVHNHQFIEKFESTNEIVIGLYIAAYLIVSGEKELKNFAIIVQNLRSKVGDNNKILDNIPKWSERAIKIKEGE